jgi:hypothetical protein
VLPGAVFNVRCNWSQRAVSIAPTTPETAQRVFISANEWPSTALVPYPRIPVSIGDGGDFAFDWSAIIAGMLGFPGFVCAGISIGIFICAAAGVLATMLTTARPYASRFIVPLPRTMFACQ